MQPFVVPFIWNETSDYEAAAPVRSQGNDGLAAHLDRAAIAVTLDRLMTHGGLVGQRCFANYSKRLRTIICASDRLAAFARCIDIQDHGFLDTAHPKQL